MISQLQTQVRTSALVVEDDESIASLLQFMLAREGYGVILAPDGRRASELIAEGQPPGLVLLDLMLPYVDGFELIHHVRSQPAWHRVPIMMLTVRSDESSIVRALDAGADDYLTKPFQPGELLARLRRLVK